MSESIYVTPRNKLKSKLLLHNKHMKDLAVELGVSRSLISLVVKGRARSKWVEEALNSIMGEELFPVKSST